MWLSPFASLRLASPVCKWSWLLTCAWSWSMFHCRHLPQEPPGPGPSVLARGEVPCPWHAALVRTPWPWLGEERGEDTISYQESRAESPVDAYSYFYVEQLREWSRQSIKKGEWKGEEEMKKEKKKEMEKEGRKEERMKNKEKERKEGRKGGRKGSRNHLTEKWGCTCMSGPWRKASPQELPPQPGGDQLALGKAHEPWGCPVTWRPLHWVQGPVSSFVDPNGS